MEILPYLKLLRDKQGSDLFFTVDSKPRIKIEGLLSEVGEKKIDSEIIEGFAEELMTEEQKTAFHNSFDIDFAFQLPDESARFRVNIFKQRGSFAMVLRLVPAKIPDLDDLKVPSVLQDLMVEKRGLMLMVGATGSGKSTTLAALLNHRNSNKAGHILTIEDPIEFSHPNLKSIVNQRELGVDTVSYKAALKASLREAPDVIMVGEIRDRDTMEAVLELCNTGHLAISTLHANNANQAIERIINLFPQDLHKQLLMDLSLNLKAIVSQRLIRSKSGKRIAAVEVMVNGPHISDLILKGALGDLKEAMEAGGQKGMQTFDTALLELYKSNLITVDEALQNADSRTNLEAKINFG